MKREAKLTGDARIVGGVAGLALVAANRIFLAGELAFGDQSRADLLAIVATMGLILDGISQVDVEMRETEIVQLKGERGRGVSSLLSDEAAISARWAATAVRTIAPVKTVVLFYEGSTILREGVLGPAKDIDAASPTFSSALTSKAETYAPDLQAVPARVDFGCLPENAQSALIQPFPGGCVAVACDRKRALSPRDIAKIRAVARRLGERLSS